MPNISNIVIEKRVLLQFSEKSTKQRPKDPKDFKITLKDFFFKIFEEQLRKCLSEIWFKNDAGKKDIFLKNSPIERSSDVENRIINEFVVCSDNWRSGSYEDQIKFQVIRISDTK